MLTASKGNGKCKACGGKGKVVKNGQERRCFACRGSGKAPGYNVK